MESIGVGLIGCGNISDAYLKAAPNFAGMRVIACADIRPEVAQEKAAGYAIEALSVEDLLADGRIGIVLNLTTPQQHVPVGLRALAAGKHVYSEKPLGIAVAEAMQLVETARVKGLRVGCAPDTFLGGVHQTARKALDDGLIGQAVAGTAFMMVPGHESWHPNPGFYYQPGGGPMLDMGPYYLTCLVNMLGPVRAVIGSTASGYGTRTVGSGPKAGETIPVNVATHVSGLLQFAGGASVSITTSFDVHKHGHHPIEIYGTKGSMQVADPNRFQGEVLVSAGKGDWQAVPQVHRYGDGNYRILGLADMAQAIAQNRPHRASLELSLHVLEIMEAIIRSADAGQRIALSHPAGRPEPLDAALPFGLLG